MKKEKNFGNKRNSNGFAKNPQNINKKGAPKKNFRLFNEGLLKDGCEPISKSEYYETIRILCNLPEKELIEIEKDNSQPYILRKIINGLLGENGLRIINEMVTRLFGNPKQEIEFEKEKNTEMDEKEKELLASLLELKDSVRDYE